MPQITAGLETVWSTSLGHDDKTEQPFVHQVNRIAMSALERTLYVSNFTEKVDEELLKELFFQVGPLVGVTIRVSSDAMSYAFVEFEDEESVLFACQVMDGVPLYGLPLMVKPRSGSEKMREWQDYLLDRGMSVESSSSPEVSPPKPAPRFTVPVPPANATIVSDFSMLKILENQPQQHADRNNNRNPFFNPMSPPNCLINHGFWANRNPRFMPPQFRQPGWQLPPYMMRPMRFVNNFPVPLNPMMQAPNNPRMRYQQNYNNFGNSNTMFSQHGGSRRY